MFFVGNLSLMHRPAPLPPVSPGDILALLGLGGLWGHRRFKKGVKAPPLKWGPEVPPWIPSRCPHFGRVPIWRHLPPGGAAPARRPWGSWEMRSKPCSTILEPLASCSPLGPLPRLWKSPFFQADAAASPVDPLRRLWPPGSQGRGSTNICKI